MIESGLQSGICHSLFQMVTPSKDFLKRVSLRQGLSSTKLRKQNSESDRLDANIPDLRGQSAVRGRAYVLKLQEFSGILESRNCQIVKLDLTLPLSCIPGS